MQKHTKASARALIGAKTDYELAKRMGWTPHSLYMMDDEKPLSDGRQWQIRAMICEGLITPGGKNE